MAHLFEILKTWYMAHMNYGSVTLLMAIESSFIPLPSEIVVPPAAWKAAEGELNIILVALCGTLGSIIGASFNYFLASTLGRTVIYKLADTKIGRMFDFHKKIEQSEALFLKHGNTATFIGRLLPGVRHLISIPAGLSKMDKGYFLLYTALGSAVWNTVLAALGYFLYSQKELLEKYYKEIGYIFLIIGAIYVIYLVIKTMRKKMQVEPIEVKANNGSTKNFGKH